MAQFSSRATTENLKATYYWPSDHDPVGGHELQTTMVTRETERYSLEMEDCA